MERNKNGNTVYNKGNIVRIGLSILRNMFRSVGRLYVWSDIVLQTSPTDIHI